MLLLEISPITKFINQKDHPSANCDTMQCKYFRHFNISYAHTINLIIFVKLISIIWRSIIAFTFPHAFSFSPFSLKLISYMVIARIFRFLLTLTVCPLTKINAQCIPTFQDNVFLMCY